MAEIPLLSPFYKLIFTHIFAGRDAGATHSIFFLNGNFVKHADGRGPASVQALMVDILARQVVGKDEFITVPETCIRQGYCLVFAGARQRGYLTLFVPYDAVPLQVCINDRVTVMTYDPPAKSRF